MVWKHGRKRLWPASRHCAIIRLASATHILRRRKQNTSHSEYKAGEQTSQPQRPFLVSYTKRRFLNCISYNV